MKKIFLQNTNILMHVYHLILIKSFPILQTLPYTATQKILSVNKKPFIRYLLLLPIFQLNDLKIEEKKNTYTVVALGGGGALC